MNGVLYGTAGGGKHRAGTLYSSTTSGGEKVLYSFSDYRPNAPVGGLLDVNGILYGTASQGPGFSGGAVFQITTSGRERDL